MPPKIYREKPEPGRIRKAVEAKHAQATNAAKNRKAKDKEDLPDQKFAMREAWKEQRRLVVEALGQEVLPEFIIGGFRVVPTHPIHEDPLTGFTEIRAFIFTPDGKEIPHPDGRWQFQAPYFEVHDGTWRKEIRRHPMFDGGEEEEEVDVPNLREDPEGGFKHHLLESIRQYLFGLENS